jgi:hypothetical protein
MYRTMLPLLMSMALIAACGDEAGNGSAATSDANVIKPSTGAPKVTFEPGGADVTTVKPSSPIQISYRIIGQPIIGQPVAIDLQFDSALGATSFNVNYRVNDSTALQLPESQASRVAVSPTIAEERGRAAQQVRVIPLREGRLYLNVAAEVETESGSFSSVTAVPIQVGAAVRESQENGVVTTDENGELIRTLPAKTD